MSADSSSTSRRLIAALWRRMVLLRLLESIGIACIIASALGLALMPILWMRGQDGSPVALALLALGICCGTIWGISSRPTKLQAAIAADQQLRLDDLLGTVLLLATKDPSDFTSPQWQQTLMAHADFRCRDLRASAVVAGRLGLRGWGTVGAAGGLLLVSSLLTAPHDLRAASDRGGASDAANAITTPVNPAAPMTSNVASHDTQSRGRAAGSGSPIEDSARDFPQDPAANPQHTDAGAASSPLPQDSAGPGDAAAANSGMAITPADPGSAKRLALSPRITGNSSQGQPATGSGAANAHANSAVAGSGGTAADTAAPSSGGHAAPPWESSNWARDSAAAESAMHSGHVPDRDADLVRDYFQRD